MKTSKLLILIPFIILTAYLLATWLGLDERVATYVVTHEQNFRASAEQGDAEGQYQLALVYSRGLGVEKDFDQALKWNRLAAEQGHAKAQYNLGMMYYFGKGVPLDKVIAYQWVLLSAAGGEQAAKDGVIALAKKLSSQQITDAKAAAKIWNQAHNK
jgi:TPR repeat protein